MNKSLLAGGAAIGAVLLARRRTSGQRGFTVAKMLERMPDDSPPKWMFTNISAIRENTDRILDLLESERGAPTDQPHREPAGQP
jgi:hypothetical protein